MDFFNFARAIEQGIYDFMMWVFFYPYTLIRILIFPAATLRYVADQAGLDTDRAFEDAMRPSIFIFVSIAIGSLLVPLDPQQVAELEGSTLGTFVASSWFGLLLFRMVGFSMFPLAGAVLFDLLRPGTVSRATLRVPFYQQSYICAPFALVVSPALVHFYSDSRWVLVMFAAAVAWFIGCQYMFFRQSAETGRLRAAGLALVVFLTGWAGLVAISLIIG